MQFFPSSVNSNPWGHSQWNNPGVFIHFPPRQSPGDCSHSLISMHTCIRGVIANPGSQSQVKLPGTSMQVPFPQTPVE